MNEGNKFAVRHGLSHTKLYRVYGNMISRTRNPNHPQYNYYGGRGIKVCEEWLNKENGPARFFNWAMSNGYREGLTIDRVDVNGDYSPSNCRWADIQTQCNNRRSNRNITYQGKTMTVAEWSYKLGGHKSLVTARLNLGWSEQDAVSLPKGSRKPKKG